MPDYMIGDAHDMALKTAESGALKRAATNLGDQFGLSLYNDGSMLPLVKRVVGYNSAEGQPGWTPPPAEPRRRSRQTVARGGQGVTRTRTYTSMEVLQMTGCTYRQLDWWCRQGHIPGQPDVVGSGHRRAFTSAQVKRVKLLAKASVIRNTRLDEAVELLG